MSAGLKYEIIRSDRRSVGLSVTAEGNVIVRAPRGLSKKEIARVVEKHRAWIEKKTAQARSRAAEYSHADESDREALTERARRMLPPLVEAYARRMGVSPTGIRITDARSRWGSCSAKNSLCFSWRLMRWPMEAVEYVVVHELAHIREKNHGPAFYQEIAAVMPDYRERAALLKGLPRG